MSAKLKTIPLCQLKRSKTNVRKTGRLADIEQLAASIEANGLLENLVVHAAANGRDPAYDVVAGARRLAALKLLVRRKKIERDARISCLVLEESARGSEASLAENFVRVPVHPADQFEAFAGLTRQGLSADEAAARFGVAPAFVLQRLKLAQVSPRLVAEYRAGAMTLDQLTAFTLSDSHAEQEEVWFERAYADLPAQTIRRLLTKSQVEGMDRRARFIGAIAYEAAGGIVLRDLFDSEDRGYFADSQLLDRMVREKLESAAQEVREEGWQWVEIHPDADRTDLWRYGRAKTTERPLSEQEEKRFLALSERYNELVDSIGEGDDSACPELDKVSAQIELLQAKKETWANEEKACAGALVTLGADGELEVLRGLLKPDAKLASGENGRERSPRKRARANGYSEAVLRDLFAHRTAALREVLAQEPETALLALLHALVDRMFYPGPSGTCLSIAAALMDRPSESVRDSKAAQAFQERHDSWAARLPEKDKLWDWLGELEATERLALLAHCVARTVNAGAAAYCEAEQARQLAAAVNLDMRDWWRPAREDFLGRLTKNDILAAVSEGVSTKASWRLAGLKKERMAREAEKLLAETGWLPSPLRTSVPPMEAAPEIASVQ